MKTVNRYGNEIKEVKNMRLTGKLKQSILEIMSDGKRRSISQIKEIIKLQYGLEFEKDYQSSHISSAFHQLVRNNKLHKISTGIYQLNQNSLQITSSSAHNEMGTYEVIRKAVTTPDQQIVNDIKVKMHKIERNILASVREQHKFILKNLEDVSMQDIMWSEEMDNMNRIAELVMYLEKFRLAPIFEDDILITSGVQIEAIPEEDESGINSDITNNVQTDIAVACAIGESSLAKDNDKADSNIPNGDVNIPVDS